MLVIVLKATRIVSNPIVVDPNTGRRITWAFSWSTDQAYVGGHGPDAKGTGEVTNPTASKSTQRNKTPWAAPGHAPSLGGGCGIFGGNPYGCPAYNDTRDPKSNAYCGQKTKRGTWAFGSSALDVDFPQGTIHELNFKKTLHFSFSFLTIIQIIHVLPAAKTTKWALGSQQTVSFLVGANHRGGYTFRLCRLPAQGKHAHHRHSIRGITEECFQKNVLKFATKTTKNRPTKEPEAALLELEEEDVVVDGVAWRPMSGKVKGGLFMDEVLVPTNLPPGDYVLSWRWDGRNPQVWVSCAFVNLYEPA